MNARQLQLHLPGGPRTARGALFLAMFLAGAGCTVKEDNGADAAADGAIQTDDAGEMSRRDGEAGTDGGASDSETDGDASSEAALAFDADGGAALSDVSNSDASDGAICRAPASGLLGLWPGDGTAGDSVGGNDGAFAGTFAPGKSGQAFAVTPTTFVSVPDNSALNSAAISVETWFRRDVTQGLADPIVKKNLAYSLEFGGYAGTGADQVIFYIYTGGPATGSGGPGWQSSPGKVVANGAWAHVVGVYDGSQVGLYIDGDFVGSGPATGPILPSTSPLQFGRDPGVPSRAFQGLIDDVGIYGRALTASEIKTLYLSGGGHKCAPTSTEVGAPDAAAGDGATAVDTGAGDAATDATPE